MRKNIETLIASGVTAHQVAKETSIPRNTAYRIFNGEANLDNVSLKNAEILNDYYLRLKTMNKPILLKVFQADNGDVFLQHGNTYQDFSAVNEYELKLQAIQEYKNNNVEQCITEYVKTFNTINYSTLDGNFIGTADMHIRDSFNKVQDYIYLYRKNEKTSFGRFIELFEKRIKLLDIDQ